MVQPPGNTNACVVDQDIRYHVAGRAGFSDGTAAFLRGQVSDNRGDEVLAGIIDCMSQRPIADISQYQLRTRSTELAHHMPTEAATGTGNQDCLVRWFRHTGKKTIHKPLIRHRHRTALAG
jgi:hypothetical protein